MWKLKGFVFSLLLISLAIAPAYAKRHAGDGQINHRGEWTDRVEQLKQVLDLTPQQETDIKEIITADREETKLLREEAKANKMSIRSTFDAEVLDETRLRELVREQAELNTDLMVAKHTTRASINQVLTPEQQEKHKQFRNERKGLQRRTWQDKIKR